MKNSAQEYSEIKNTGEVFVSAENNYKVPSTDQDLDCWADLWQRIKAKGSKFLEKRNKAKEPTRKIVYCNVPAGEAGIIPTEKNALLQKTDNKAKKEIFRFLIAGTVVNATDFSIYYLLFHYLSLSISKGISFTCAGIVGYLLNKYWTFKFNQPSYAEGGRYLLINFLALGINVLINQILLSLWPGAVFVALVIATIVTSLFTFVCFKWWVFRV
ncbi:MAG: GtrA family protein [Candidatus Omnitrophica bacterium]|nr:GtrA family protein [Candidatus Omnitrophota bacterium]